MKNYKIAVAGTGYVGLSIATLLSQHHQVTAVDIVPEKVEMINNHKSPIQDDYIEKYLAEKKLNLTATLDAKAAYSDADFVVIATPTNYDSHTQHFDTSAVEVVIKLVMKYNPNAIMVIKSTIPVGYTASVREKFGSKNIIFSPEFLRESKAHNVTVDYAFQDISDIPGELPEGRTKPWGTGQAVLAAKNVIDTPFIVINADDYYGKEGFKAVHDYLVNGGESCMAGFVLKNTLSDNGGVTRGICKMDAENNLTEVVETKNIVKTADGAEADGVVVDVNSLVSMNMWGLTPGFLDVLENGFKKFFEKEVPSNPQKAEYLIPIFIGELLEQGKMFVKVLKTNDTWYGMTYHEDVVFVKESFRKMLENGVYKADLFSDL